MMFFLFLLPVQIYHFISDGSLILTSNEVLEINTTAPSIYCSPSCYYHASHENRSSSGYTYPVAVMIFIGDIVFKSDSTVKVVGEYALSITSLNGSIDIQTDINMTCGETLLNTTCLGGFTQSAVGKSVGIPGSKTLVYQGKGSILISCFLFQLYHYHIYTACYGLYDHVHVILTEIAGPNLLFVICL